MNALMLTGLFIDWFMTRDWRGVSLFLLPAILAAVLGIMALLGLSIPANQLARDYVLAAESVLAGDQEWAFAEPGKANEEIPRFAQALFYRAQSLRPNDPKTLFFIAATQAAQGANETARLQMEALAPESAIGYEPAHAWLANAVLFDTGGKMQAEELKSFRHHIGIGVQWEDIPPHLLAAAANLALRDGDQSKALQLMQRAADAEAQYDIQLVRMAAQTGNGRLTSMISDRVQPRLEARVEQGSATAQDRIDLADVLLLQNDWEQARLVLHAGLDVPNLVDTEEAKLRLALSEVYRLRFDQTLEIGNGDWSADIRLLDRAMRIDPSNPRVAETVAKLARVGGEEPPELLLKQLSRFLAEGTATPVTHAWIAEAHILRAEYPKAIQHLKNVLERLPNSPHSLNNLAYALALVKESGAEQWREGLGYADQAIQLMPRVPDFYDTKATLLRKLQRPTEAIAAYETGLELQPRPDFHEQLSQLYRAAGNNEIAEAHSKAAADLRMRAAARNSLEGEQSSP